MGMRVLGPLMLCLAARAQGPIGTQLPITFPASMAEPYVQSAANALTNATQAGANLIGEVRSCLAQGTRGHFCSTSTTCLHSSVVKSLIQDNILEQPVCHYVAGAYFIHIVSWCHCRLLIKD